MGAWGIGLYANDLSRDVRDSFRDLVRLPVSEAELVETALKAFPTGRDAGDEEYTDFWLTLADLLHAYGIAAPEVFERALAIVENGDDIEMKRALEMSEADLRSRARLLDDLAAKWRSPAARPKRRRTMKRPEPFLFEAGDCVVFPTQKGNAAPAFLSAAKIAGQFRPDGWGAFVVLAAARRHGYWACYLVGKLYLETPSKPDLEVCRGAVFSGIPVGVPGIPSDAAVKTVTISAPEARKLELDAIGRLALDQEPLRAAFADRYALVDQPYWSISGLLRPYGDARSLIPERPVRMNRLPLGRFLL